LRISVIHRCFFFEEERFDYHKIIEKLLSNNCGQLDDGVKAQVLVLCIDKPYRDKKWEFDPSKMKDRNIGRVLRKFFICHSEQALGSIEHLQIDISRETNKLLLLPIKKGLASKYALNDDSWNIILQFADWRKGVCDDVEYLNRANKIIDDEIVSFFLGGIKSCFERKFGIKEDIWSSILEFAGRKIPLPSIEEIPPIQPLAHFRNYTLANLNI